MKFRKRSNLIILALLATLTITGCGQLKEMKQEKENKEIMAKRYVEIGDYIEAYLEHKYQEDFQNGGISDILQGSYVEFNFRSNDTGIYIRPAYIGDYVSPEYKVSIKSGSVDDTRYAQDKRESIFAEHSRAKINEIFPGKKNEYNTWVWLKQSFENMQYKQVETVDPKYFDIEYLIKDEEDILADYYLNINYFRDVYPENKDEMTEDIYDFLMYTRSLGFKKSQIIMTILDESVLESEVYKEYKGGDLWMFMAKRDIRFVQVEINYEESEEIQTLEDLKEIIIFRERTKDGYNHW